MFTLGEPFILLSKILPCFQDSWLPRISLNVSHSFLFGFEVLHSSFLLSHGSFSFEMHWKLELSKAPHPIVEIQLKVIYLTWQILNISLPSFRSL